MQRIVSVIIITYNPVLDIVQRNVDNILKSPYVKEVVIVDNSKVNTLVELEYDECVTIIPLGENKGIATAQNIGLQHIKKSDAVFSILFDQDSDIETDLIEKLVRGFNELSQLGYNVAAVGPRPFDLFENKDMRPLIQKEQKVYGKWSLTKQIIASGKLIKISVLDEVGMMEDELFIDGVDHEWCWRAGSKGFNIAIIDDAIMRHRLGDSRGTFLGITYKIGSPIRLYYQFRNILILCRRSYVPMYWKIRCLISMLSRFIIFSIKCDDAKLRRHYMIKGFLSGIKKDTGIIKD